MSRLRYSHIYGPVLITLWSGLFLDSSFVAGFWPGNQLLTNILVLLVFALVYSRVTKVARQLMLFAVVVSYAGELTLSLGLGMYTYRLENVPLYVPFGHALVYAAVYYMTREPWLRRHRQTVTAWLYPLMISYSTLWLWLAQDLFGFLSMLVILVLFKRHPETKLFFLLMFFMVVYLELVGTYYQCWQWPPVWFNSISLVPSANPPSGIGAFYFALDGLCLLVYRLFDQTRWRRLQALKTAPAAIHKA